MNYMMSHTHTHTRSVSLSADVFSGSVRVYGKCRPGEKNGEREGETDLM